MTAAVLSIGTELTRGELVNSNAAWLSEQLTSLGFEVLEHATVDDHVGRIVEVVKRLAVGYSVVVCTGGLGPTTDDLTTEAVAQAMGKPLVRDEPSLERIQRYFAAVGRTMSPSNQKQADFPQGASVLANEVGTAPGFSVKIADCSLFFMPGVPREMKHIWEERLVSRLAQQAVRTTAQVHLRTFGMPESQLGDQLRGVEAQFPGVTIGYRASLPEIEVKVLARGKDEPAAQALAEKAAAVVRARLGDIVFGDREDTFAGAVGRTLRDRGLTLAVAESCTGGLVGEMLTSVPGSSEFLLFDAVVYSNGAKSRVLGLSDEILRAYGAVSEEAALAMADGVLRVGEADLAVSITGVAGPGGGSDEKPVGTVWLGVASRGGTRIARHFKLSGDRQRIRVIAAHLALRMVQRLAQGREP